MQNHYRVGPVYRAGLVVCGGMCAGLGIAALVASAMIEKCSPRECPPVFRLRPLLHWDSCFVDSL
jgi:hypothetical protein